MNKEELRKVLEQHKGWRNGTGGKRADRDGAYLEGAYLEGAYLEGADLRGAYLRGADLRRTYLEGAYLRGADLREADLRGADLRGAYLEGVYLEGAYLRGADLEFFSFPSIRLISSINLGEVSSELALELMRWDARCHPHPERFDEWSKGGA